MPIYSLSLSPHLDGFFQRRQHSSRSSGNAHNGGSRSFKLDALTFSVSPEHALQQLETWAYKEQGLNYLMRWSSVRIGAAYVPVWSFDVNIRYVVEDSNGKRRYDWKPSVFRDAYGSQPVIHLPGLSAYAGHSYRRSLVNPLHNTTLVFMGDQAQPFGKWMLRDMELSNGERLQIFPDPWNAPRARAFSVVHEELEAVARSENPSVRVETEVIRSRRVYMPTYVMDYSVVGLSYRAFVSGCDAGAGVSAVSHKVVDYSNQDIQQATHSFLGTISNAAQMGARVLGGRQLGTLILIAAQATLGLLGRFLTRIPVIGLAAGAFVGFRKIIQPWMSSRLASAEWERQREREAMNETRLDDRGGDDFVDTGRAMRYFTQNRERIIQNLAGDYDHEQGDFDWYKEWEEWARRQWESQQQQQQQQQQQHDQRQQYGQQQQAYGQGQQKRAKPKKEFQWDFDPNDPYSVLGVKRGATKSEVSAAFRREMLKHHPDVQAGATEAEKERSVERSKIITQAYQSLKKQMK